MKKTPLQSLLKHPPLRISSPDSFWPIPDQFVGIEIELENLSNKEMRFHRENGRPFWTEHEDGSLRNGIEYVLAQPMMGDSLKEAIHYFFRTFRNFEISPRTSIHVHMNMLQEEESIEGLKNMVVLYYMFENALFAIADENRKWNGYCNPFEDNPPAILHDLLRLDNVKDLARSIERSAAQNNNRYYGLNINALHRYGTLEFRHLPLVHEEQRLFDWIKLIMEMKKAANRMADEDHTPATLFKTPDDLGLIEEYMPLYGKQLLSLVGTGESFVRLSAISGLACPYAPNLGGMVALNNPAFLRFQEAQVAAGRKASTTPKKRGKVRVERVAELRAGPPAPVTIRGVGRVFEAEADALPVEERVQAAERLLRDADAINPARLNLEWLRARNMPVVNENNADTRADRRVWEEAFPLANQNQPRANW